MRSAIIAIIAAATAACQSSDVSRDVGARCDGRAECNQLCASGSAYPGGFCTVLCGSRDDCPSDTTCVERQGGICLFECTHDTDCAFLGQGWSCKPADLHGGGIKVMVCSG
jgi:hypothetical protein